MLLLSFHLLCYFTFCFFLSSSSSSWLNLLLYLPFLVLLILPLLVVPFLFLLVLLLGCCFFLSPAFLHFLLILHFLIFLLILLFLLYCFLFWASASSSCVQLPFLLHVSCTFFCFFFAAPFSSFWRMFPLSCFFSFAVHTSSWLLLPVLGLGGYIFSSPFLGSVSFFLLLNLLILLGCCIIFLTAA